MTPDKHHLVVDGARLDAARLNARERSRLLGLWEPLRDGFALVSRDALPAATIEKLETSGLTQPVFRKNKALIVVLPEIRVEDSGREGASRLQSWVEKNNEEAEVVQRLPERVVLRPKSRGVEATLNLANRLQEELRPEAAAPRMMWITAKPKKG